MIEFGEIEGARDREELTESDRAVIVVFDVLSSVFPRELAEERARNLVCAMVYNDEPIPHDEIVGSLAIVRRADYGSFEVSDRELQELAREIVDKTAPLKLF